MCYFNDVCTNFIPSPYNSSVCAIFCMHSPNVTVQDEAPDMLCKEGKRIFVKLNKPNQKKNDKRTLVDDEMAQADELIKQMEEDNLRIKPKEQKVIDDTEGELIDGTEPPTLRKNRETNSTVEQIMKRLKTPKSELSTKEKKSIEDSVQIHDDAQSLKEKMAEIEEEMERRTPCPYCGKEFKNVSVHLRFCKAKKQQKSD